MRTLPWLLAAAWLCGCATVHQSMVTQPWLEVRTAHFRVLTNADRKQAVMKAIELERHRRALLLLWSPDADPKDVTDVAMLRGRELFEVAGDHAVGYFQVTGPKAAFVFGAEQYLGTDSHRVLVHELGHMVTRLVAEQPPQWVNEGLSDYLETVRISPEGEIAFGGPNNQALEWLANVGLMDLDKLWTWRPADQSEIGQYYAAAWVLCHYLISEKPKQFSTMMRELAAGRDGRGAWVAAFGDVPLSGYWQAVRDYAARNRWQLLTTRLPPISEATSVRRLSKGEVHAAIGWLQAIQRRPAKLATRVANVRMELGEAERLDPGSPLVKDLLAWRGLMDLLAEGEARREAAAKAPAVCPEDVAAGAPLSPGAWAPRSISKQFSPHLFLELDEGSRSISDARVFELAAGEVLVLTGAPLGSPALAVLRRAGPQGCVVNGWRDEQHRPGALSIASWWEAKDSSQALLLLTFPSPRPDGTTEPKWMALATDGKRAWWAARGQDGSPQLGGREPRLRREGGKLALELKDLASGAAAVYPLEVGGEFGAARKRVKAPLAGTEH